MTTKQLKQLQNDYIELRKINNDAFRELDYAIDVECAKRNIDFGEMSDAQADEIEQIPHIAKLTERTEETSRKLFEYGRLLVNVSLAMCPESHKTALKDATSKYVNYYEKVVNLTLSLNAFSVPQNILSYIPSYDGLKF